MIAVISGNKREFQYFTRHWVDPDDISKFKYIGRIDDVRGVNFTEVVRVGTHFKNRDAEEIYNAALARIKS